MNQVRIFAPATCGNVCVGYDIMGLCYENAGDVVSIKRNEEKKVVISSIEGIKAQLPLEAEKNTAGVVLLELMKKLELDHGFELSIEKGIPLGSGMGGSAASAVGALVGANHLLGNPLSREELLALSLKGEELSSGHAHADNSAPCLYGGLVLIRQEPLKVVSLPFPKNIHILLTLPELTVETRKAREVLKDSYPLTDYVTQSSNLAGFLAGCASNDMNLIRESFQDILVEPLRADLTKGFSQSKQKALELGALGHSLSGSGPAQITLCPDHVTLSRIKQIIEDNYKQLNIPVRFFEGGINNKGARIL